jgi:GTP cyclohydrolase FolE2
VRFGHLELHGSRVSRTLLLVKSFCTTSARQRMFGVKQKRQRTIQVRLAEEEWRRIQKLAKLAGESMSVLVRSVLRREYETVVTTKPVKR